MLVRLFLRIRKMSTSFSATDNCSTPSTGTPAPENFQPDDAQVSDTGYVLSTELNPVMPPADSTDVSATQPPFGPQNELVDQWKYQKNECSSCGVPADVIYHTSNRPVSRRPKKCTANHQDLKNGKENAGASQQGQSSWYQEGMNFRINGEQEQVSWAMKNALQQQRRNASP